MELIRKSWNQDDYGEFRKYLKGLLEESYKKFNEKIIPDTPLFYGIRVPKLREISKEILKGNSQEFINLKKEEYHEEIIIEGLVMAGESKDYEEMLEYMKAFSEKIYNWAICDTVSFKGVKKYKREFLKDSIWFYENENPWIVRFGLKNLMDFYLDEGYIKEVLEITKSVKSDFYYVEMMQAWLLATAFAKFRKETLTVLEKGGFSQNVYNMTVRKIRDSFRISKEDKEMILKFKR